MGGSKTNKKVWQTNKNRFRVAQKITEIKNLSFVMTLNCMVSYCTPLNYCLIFFIGLLITKFHLPANLKTVRQ